MSKAKLQPFRQGPPPQKNSSGGRRISFPRRPGPDSRVTPTSFPGQSSSGKNFSEKDTFLQHTSRIDPTGEGTFCSRRVIFTRDTAKSEVGRQIKTFFKELEETDWGQKNFGNCVGLQNPISHGSNPGQGSSQSKNVYRSIYFIESRNRKHVAERCHSESATCFRRVFKQPVSGRQIRWRKEASDKPEKSKFVYTISAFRNGGPPSNERSLARGGLHVQDRSSRCIFYNTNKSKVQEIPQVQMGGNTVRVSLPLLWTRPSTSDIYKINESPYFSTAAPKHSPNNIPGRHVDNGQVSTGIDLSLRHCDLPPAESGICTEFKEVSSGTISENRIFGNGYRLNEDGNLIASREACKTNVTMQTSSREQRDYHHGLNKVNRETRINCPSNTACTTSSSVLATFANPGIKTFEMLSC